MINKKIMFALIALLSVSVFLAYSTFAALSTSQTVSSTGTINVSASLGVYSDSACTVPLSSFNWGSLSPGTTTDQTIYVKNTGSGVSLTLNMAASNWSPTDANSYMTLTWNPTSNTLAPGASTKAVITLTVSSTIVDIQNFNVQIFINGVST
jgi:hypothetical protein